MVFTSLTFIVFFCSFISVYFFLKKNNQNRLLLVSSYIFYGWWDWRFLFLLGGSTLIDFFVGKWLSKTSNCTKRKVLLCCSLFFNLGALGIFKYFNFFADSFTEMLSALGMQTSPLLLNVILPVGISFYTFQTLSYTIDVYRRRIEACSDFTSFAVYVAFFPQLVAGPIERASHFLPQIQRDRKVSGIELKKGVWLAILGYFQKTVIADNFAEISNDIFNAPDQAHGIAILVAVAAFAMQIYGDFSGYSNIARGISKILGFDLMRNFRNPYFALNPSDFWQRWHISLSSWLRDYLYIPLGGNRKSEARTSINLLVTMLLGGLWHGAAWNFVLWGIYHGTILTIYKSFPNRFRSISFFENLKSEPIGVGLRWACMLILTGIGWLLFRINSINDLPLMIGNLLEPSSLYMSTSMLMLFIFLIGISFTLDAAAEISEDEYWILGQPLTIQMFIYFVMFLCITNIGSFNGFDFIYFQF